MDFEEDRFADDEEHDDLFNEDEDAKDAEKRIKEDQLKANVFNLKDEKEYDAEEMREIREREARRVLGKGVRKALKKRERNFDYSSGSDVNPYTDEEVNFSPIFDCNPETNLYRAPTTAKPNEPRRRNARRQKKKRTKKKRSPPREQILPPVDPSTQTP
jgi:hypothetical protein